MKFLIIFGLLFTFLLLGCKENLPVKKSINSSYNLINQDSSNVNFPNDYKEKITVMGFIFTNCPDICPLTTQNMLSVQQKLKDKKNNNVKFVTLSFDPRRDTPSVLKSYAEVRNINTKDFQFLTGTKITIDSLLKEMNVFAFVNDTTYSDDGKPVYYFTHTDRITLIDKHGRIRKEYRGSKVIIENIINDIKSID